MLRFPARFFIKMKGKGNSTMGPVRRWGQGPYSVAVIHGGPGAPGEVAPVARELSTARGVLEPFQTSPTLDGQVQELREVLASEGTAPFALIGFSYGAVLSYLCAARYPELVRTLILVGCPPFEERYAARITETRLSRLSPEQRLDAQEFERKLADPGGKDKHEILSRLGMLMAQADTYDSIQAENEMLHCQYDIYQPVWDEVRRLRQSGTLLRMGGRIACPVLALHGDYDPHPVEGVREPLSRVIRFFRCITLKKCGHRPWIEREAIDPFYSVLIREIGTRGEPLL